MPIFEASLLVALNLLQEIFSIDLNASKTTILVRKYYVDKVDLLIDSGLLPKFIETKTTLGEVPRREETACDSLHHL